MMVSCAEPQADYKVYISYDICGSTDTIHVSDSCIMSMRAWANPVYSLTNDGVLLIKSSRDESIRNFVLCQGGRKTTIKVREFTYKKICEYRVNGITNQKMH